MERKLRDYQRQGFYYAGRVEHPALFWDMRLGKTLVTIRRTIKDFSNVKAVLIVAPYSALYGWKRELIEEGIPESDITELYGTRNERIEKMVFKKPWVLFNKEGHLRLPEIANQDWQSVILDESTFIKSPTAKVTRFFTSNFRKIQRRWILTGTPCPESELDLFTQLQFLDPSILMAQNYWAFRHLYCIKVNNYDWELTNTGRKFITQRMAGRCSILSRKDVKLDVQKVYMRRLVKLPLDVRRVYNTIEKEFILEIGGRVLDSTIFSMEKWQWLRRVCGGLINGEIIHDAKVNELLSLLTGELKCQQVVVWCRFVAELNYLYSVFTRERIKADMIYGDVSPAERERIRRDFSAGNIQVLIGQPEVFKHGTDLSVSDTVVYYSSPEGLETRIQSEDRVIDVQKHGNGSVLIIDILVENTVDEDVYEALLNKETRQELVKRIIKRGRV